MYSTPMCAPSLYNPNWHLSRGQYREYTSYCQVPLAGPKYPCSGTTFQGVPFPSAVFPYTVFPHQLSGPAGSTMQKKMITVATATPESSAADRT